jgi:hypothetical protein
MALALERAEDQIATEVLGNACIITTLLPLVLANISPLVTLDPRVSGCQETLQLCASMGVWCLNI